MRRERHCGGSTTWAVLLLSVSIVGWPLSGEAAAPPLQSAPVVDTTFRHARHQDYECLECHEMQSTHGAFLVQDVSDCRSCHHTQRVDFDCGDCHTVSSIRNIVYPVQRTFSLTVSEDASVREIPFKHARHLERACVECHAEGPVFAVPDLDCQGCHEEHHAETTTGCMTCHQQPPDDAHTIAVHQTCSGSGCHQESPIQSAPRSRVGCLWCHDDKADHEGSAECDDCHLLSLPDDSNGGV